MNYSTRKEVYKEIEKERDSKVLAYVTGNRQGFETYIASDCIPVFAELLEQIGQARRISLILHTNGGDLLVARQLVNLIRMFCENLEVIVPVKAMSAGTLIALGSNLIIMTKYATLGPIDPSVTNPFNPKVHGSEDYSPISVESVRAYLDMARKELALKEDESLCTILQNLTNYIHPLVLGDVFRSQAQIRFIAEQLLLRQVRDREKLQSIINFLCSDSGSHNYTVDLKEATELGLNAEAPSDSLYTFLREVQKSFTYELQFSAPSYYYPTSPENIMDSNGSVSYSLSMGLIEGAFDEAYRFDLEGETTAIEPHDTVGEQVTLKNRIIFEGWRKHDEHNE